MELSDDVITLRPFTLNDAAEHLAGEDNEQIKWLSGGQSTIDGVQSWIKKNLEYHEKGGPIFNFAIVQQSSGRLAGMVESNNDYQNLDGLKEGDANISYGLYPTFRGKGYTTKAVLLIINFLKQKGFKRAVIRANPENKDSLKIPERCGFEETETITTRSGEKLKIFILPLL